MVALRSVRTLVLSAGGAVLLVGLLLGVLLPSAHAQSQRADDMFYGRLGGGLSDFTSDLSSWRPTHPFGGGKFTRGAGPPFVFVGEVGYQFSPHWALGIGIQGGNYPVEVYPEIEGISDSYRYTPRVLGRYTMGGGAVAPYVDLGGHATLGGDRPPTRIGAGPSVGGGVDIRLGRAASLYVESRVNLTVPSGAVDGSDSGTRFDVTGQLLGIGLKVHLTAPTPPRIIRLEGPDTLDTGTSVTFAATVNEEAADRPLDYQWDFGDGATATGRTATHAYDRPGRYVVSFSARNRAGTAEAASPTHTYEAPGTYTARLRVSNPDGDDTRTVTVRVARPAGADTSGAAAAAQNPTDSSGTGPPAVPPADTSAQERWGIVVASMSEEGQAAPVARRYRERLPEPLRVEVRGAESDRGVRRHRVVIGPFEGTEAAQQVLRERAETLPSGAWLLRLE
ncbi:plastocyanin [Salinibacter ruber]|uniref:Plastocyanin n=1 Tax=Salinibacter ruber TaxID=146919 RepID=A0A9X2TGT0_9BACT|nr:PKD domain-containing protein [Salinibacter ruber]MCS3678422.1 plastocyanin [Salinibacter ruber]MCS3681709.1 plastocyanin [Salinibacter ruber]